MGAPRMIYRYVSGRPMGWLPSADGGYLRRGSTGGVGPWGRLPGWQRQAWRLGVPGATLSTLLAYQAHPDFTAGTAAVAGAVGGVQGARQLRHRWQTRRFRAVYIRPTVAALRLALGDAPVSLHVDPSLGTLMPRLAKPMSPMEVRVRTWYGAYVEPAVRWLPERGMRAGWAARRLVRPVTDWAGRELRRPQPADAGPRIELDAGVLYLAPEQRAIIKAIIGEKIPAGDLNDPAWDMVGDRVTATWTVRKRPPASVGYADLDARFAGLKDWEIFLGLGVGGRPVIASFHEDSPHIACSAGSGAGKSVLAQLVAVQNLGHGGLVIILDLKGSHRWARNLPGVKYCTSPTKMHEALIEAADDARARNTQADLEEEGWDPGPRVLVIFEEMNATVAMLRQYWESIREKGDPKASPAIQGFRELMYMGRSAKYHLLGIAQMLTAHTTGGPESRENFGIRCLARYTKNAWQMLAPEAAMPRPSRTLGRWQVVIGGVATETQVCFLTAHEARLFVAKMSPTQPRPGDNSWSEPIKGEPRSGGDTGTPEPADPLSERVTLRQAVDRGLTPWKFAAAKKRLQRARSSGTPPAPTPAGKSGTANVYSVGDLIVWIEAEMGIAATAEADQ